MAWAMSDLAVNPEWSIGVSLVMGDQIRNLNGLLGLSIGSVDET